MILYLDLYCFTLLDFDVTPPREVILAAAEYSTLRDRQHIVQISDSSWIPASLYLKQACGRCIDMKCDHLES